MTKSLRNVKNVKCTLNGQVEQLPFVPAIILYKLISWNYKSQPWPFSGTVLMGFFCDLEGDDETITLDENELSSAEWFDREMIPVEPSRDSLTNEMIMTFVQGKEPR